METSHLSSANQHLLHDFCSILSMEKTYYQKNETITKEIKKHKRTYLAEL